MDTRSDTPIAPAIEFAQPDNARPARPAQQAEEPQTSMLELNSILLIVLGGLTAILTAGAFLLSHT